MLRIAIQTKGRLNEESVELMAEAGVSLKANKRKLLTKSHDFPIEVLYLRDDDIPQAVANGVADIGIVGQNEVDEKGYNVDTLLKLGFGECRLSLAIPKGEEYDSVSWFDGKRVATSYPKILAKFFAETGMNVQIHEIAGSVEIAPAVGMGDAIFDIVSSGSTLVSNGLKEVEVVCGSEAVLIATPGLSDEKRKVADQLVFRFESVLRSRGMKYVLFNIPTDSVKKASQILPGMKSPTVLSLDRDGWSAMHVVISESELWAKIEELKAIGAEDILVLALEKMIK